MIIMMGTTKTHIVPFSVDIQQLIRKGKMYKCVQYWIIKMC